MLRHASLLLSAAGVILAMSACERLTSVSNGGTPILIVTLNARSLSTGYTTNPVATFYRVGSATFSSAGAASDRCRTVAYDPNAVPAPITAPPIGGGAFVAVRVSGRSDTLRKVSAAELTYRLATSRGVSFAPGDTITFVIPGDAVGFPGVTVEGRTAETFTLAPIVPPTAGQALTMTWTPPADANAAMLVSLRYNDGTGTGLNAQVFCDFKDVGNGTVPATIIAPWTGSAMRDVLAQRLRTALVRVPGATDSYFNMISIFDVPTPVSP